MKVYVFLFDVCKLLVSTVDVNYFELLLSIMADNGFRNVDFLL